MLRNKGRLVSSLGRSNEIVNDQVLFRFPLNCDSNIVQSVRFRHFFSGAIVISCQVSVCGTFQFIVVETMVDTSDSHSSAITKGDERKTF